MLKYKEKRGRLCYMILNYIKKLFLYADIFNEVNYLIIIGYLSNNE